MFIASVAYINDQALGLVGQSPLSGHQIPVGVIGPLVVFLAVVNPLLSRLRRTWGMRPAEIAVVIGMMLVACGIPLRGLMEHFPAALGLPAYWNALNPGWQKYRLLEYVPRGLLPAEGKYDRHVTDALLSGLGKSGSPIGLDQVPWEGMDAVSEFLASLGGLAGCERHLPGVGRASAVVTQ
jgi:hypothetical protein